MMTSAVGSCQSSPKMPLDSFALYEKTLENLERHMRDLPNPSLFRKMAQKLLELSQREIDVTKGISDAFGADFPEITIQCIKELDQHIKNLAEEGFGDLEKFKRSIGRSKE